MIRNRENEPLPEVLSKKLGIKPLTQMGAGKRLKVNTLNAHLICSLCSGYYIDATAIAVCQHTFCRSCIVRYLETNSFCPICDVQIHHSRPRPTLIPDKTLQDLVYKLVPGLYQNEMRQRREFYAMSGDDDVGHGEECGSPYGARFFSQDDSISLSLEYYNGPTEEEEDEKINQSNGRPKRYLQCPAAVTVRHLKKFLRMKFNISTDNRVDIIYSDECLPEEFSLIDVAYTFMWQRTSPMRFSYRILNKRALKTHVPQKVLKTASKIEEMERGNPKHQSSLEQQRQNEYLGHFNLNPTNSGSRRSQHRSNNVLSEFKAKKEETVDKIYQESEDGSGEKFPSSEDSNASGLRIISEKEDSLKGNSEESQESLGLANKDRRKCDMSLADFSEEAKDGFPPRKTGKNKFKTESKKERKRHDDLSEKRRKSTSYSDVQEGRKESFFENRKRRKSMVESYNEEFLSRGSPEEEELGNHKIEALRKVFVTKEKPEVSPKRKEEEGRRKKRKKSKHHEGEAKKRKTEIVPAAPSILSIAKNALKLKVKLIPNKPVMLKPEEKEEAGEKPKAKPPEEVDSDKDSSTKPEATEQASKKPMTDKERLLHLRAVRHKSIVNKNSSPKDYINAPPSLTISKVDSSDLQPAKSSLVESRPSLEIMLVNPTADAAKNKKPDKVKSPAPSPKTEQKDVRNSEVLDTFGVLDLSGKSTRTKENGSSSSSPKDALETPDKSNKSTQQSILQVAQNLVNRKLSAVASPDSKLRTGFDNLVDHSAAMRNLMTLSDTAVNILMAAQNQGFPTKMESPKRTFPTGSTSTSKPPPVVNSTKPFRDCENGSSLKIPVFPMARERTNPIPPIPNLHEIFPRGRGRPVGSLNRPAASAIKPGQNQTVRQIPNPSVVLNRQSNQLNLMKASVPAPTPAPAPTPTPTPIAPSAPPKPSLSPTIRTENGDVKGTSKIPNPMIPLLQSIKPKPKIEEEEINQEKNEAKNIPVVPKTINNHVKSIQNGSEKHFSCLKNGEEKKSAFKINNNNNNTNSIKRMESMARNIESVAAGLTARAVSNAMIDAK